VGVGLTPNTVGAEFADRARPRSGNEDSVETAASVVRRFLPPFLEFLVLQIRSAEFMAETRGEPGEPILFPHVHDLGPLAGGSHGAPDPEAELVAFFLRDRAPVRGHVVHVVRPVRADDVDELVGVDLFVHVAQLAL